MYNGKRSAVHNPANDASDEALKVLASLGFVSIQVLIGKNAAEAEKVAMAKWLAEKRASKLAKERALK
ncbi:MAG: hypothetical protein ACRCWB_11750 [Enterovibrio sp.]